MPVNYFDKNCKNNSSKKIFGLCDDPPPSHNPAYIDEENNSKWIGIVNNKLKKSIDFYAIDNCIDIFREDGKMESRCDGVLFFEKKLIFVELKQRDGGQWLKKGREQLTATIKRFKSENDINQFTNISAYVCNSLRPKSHSGQFENLQKFKDDTGFLLFAKQIIDT